MAKTIACRIASYGNFEDRAWAHLPTIGMTNVEMPAPPRDQWDTMKAKLADHGLTATSLQSLCDVKEADAVEVMKPQLEACAAFGARFCFLSAKAGEMDRNVLWERMQSIGEVGREFGVTVVVETHPPLAENGDVARQTMEAIGHPNIRINFDTANVRFFNENVTTVGELAKVIDYVATIHLKDTVGGYQVWDFPALGKGVVEFPEVFAMLDARHFDGVYTIELEGTKGVEFTEEQQLQYVADSAAYLKQLGVL